MSRDVFQGWRHHLRVRWVWSQMKRQVLWFVCKMHAYKNKQKKNIILKALPIILMSLKHVFFIFLSISKGSHTVVTDHVTSWLTYHYIDFLIHSGPLFILDMNIWVMLAQRTKSKVLQVETLHTLELKLYLHVTFFWRPRNVIEIAHSIVLHRCITIYATLPGNLNRWQYKTRENLGFSSTAKHLLTVVSFKSARI